jgi:hypothetical protein
MMLATDDGIPLTALHPNPSDIPTNQRNTERKEGYTRTILSPIINLATHRSHDNQYMNRYNMPSPNNSITTYGFAFACSRAERINLSLIK